MKLKIDADSPVALRLAYRFWLDLGRPPGFHTIQTLEEWAFKIESLWRNSGLNYEGFRWFVIWALRKDDPDGGKYGNDFTARNLRAARDPMASFVKQFETTFSIFTYKAEKVLPLLIERLQQEDEDAACAASFNPNKWVDALPKDAQPWQVENARFMDADDAAYPMRQPLPGETVQDWVERECRSLRDPDWRCDNCVYPLSLDGEEDDRTTWCPDCAEERKMWEDEDRKWMEHEAPSVSCLTEEWLTPDCCDHPDFADGCCTACGLKKPPCPLFGPDD